MSYIKNKKMLNLVRGKRIAVVGPSPHLLGNDIGSYLDEYDIICRLNNDIYPRGYEKDYGSRTDVISWAGDSRYCANFSNNLKANKDIVQNIKLVFLSSIKAQHDWKGSVEENFKTVNKDYNFPYDYIGEKNYQLAINTFGTEPNSGQMTIWMFLQYPIKELFITGFSFYNQFSELKNNRTSFYDVDMIYSSIPLASHHNPLSGHNQDKQKKSIVNQLYTYSSIIKIDSYLNSLLKINHPNLKKLNK